MQEIRVRAIKANDDPAIAVSKLAQSIVKALNTQASVKVVAIGSSAGYIMLKGVAATEGMITAPDLTLHFDRIVEGNKETTALYFIVTKQ